MGDVFLGFLIGLIGSLAGASLFALGLSIERKMQEEDEVKDGFHTYSDEQIDEIDRNARAYGWEVGYGTGFTETFEELDEHNPFVNKNWRDLVEGDSDE